MSRRLTITGDLIRAYSRRGNYHSDPETAAAVGLPGLVAQGLQVAGPAYGELLDAWGADFLATGECDLRFVGVVYSDDTVEATTDIDGDTATLVVTNASRGTTAVSGTARVTRRLE